MHHFHRSRSAELTKSMSSGNIYQLISAFALPIFFSQVFQQLYNTADAFIVGKFLGTEALAAVSSSGTLIFLMTSFFEGLAMGAGVVISRAFGAGDDDRVSKAIHTNIALGIVCGIFLTIVGVLLTPVFLVWMKTDPDVLPEAIEYFRYYFLGVFAVILYNMCKSIMNALGDSRRPLYYLIISSVVNVILDVLFIGGFKWGVWAAAVATVISQALSLVLCMIHLLKKGNIFTVSIKKIRFHGNVLKEIIRFGLPAGVQNSVIGFANVILQSQINSFGKLAMAAYGTYMKIEGFAFLPITSFTMAITTFISQNLGAQEYDRAKKGARFGIIAAVVLAELIGVVCYILAPQLIGMFDSTAKVVELGVMEIRTESLFYCLMAFSHSVAAVFRGAGKAFVPMFVLLFVWCVIRICYILLMMHYFGNIQLIYMAYPITWTISSIILMCYYKFSDWIHGFDRREKLHA